MAEPMPRLRILVQPKALYRERYIREINRQQNRAQRFIHGETNTHNTVYPTVEIPKEWLVNIRPYYIRLGLVTVPNERVNLICVHPYILATEEDDVIRHKITNSLYFPISDIELQTGRKSFHFCLQKLTHRELKDHGPLRILNAEEYHRPNGIDLSDARKTIEYYQLYQSQLVFSLAAFEIERQTELPVTYYVSTVFSQVITGTTTPSNDNDTCFRYAPQTGDCKGGDEILMFIPQLDKRKKLDIRFEHHTFDPKASIHRDYVDEKTISFSTPPCPVQLTRNHPRFSIPIVITLNDKELIRVQFTYLSLDTCLICNSDLTSVNLSSSTTKKRSLTSFQNDEDDQIHLSNLSSNQTERNFETISTSQFEDKILVLDNAIRQGNIDLALQLIENTNSYLEQMNSQGETPLILAAKFNRTKLIERILQKRPELIKQTDKLGNNIFHILAQITHDQAKKTLEDILTKLDTEAKHFLIEQLNNDKQTAKQVAENHYNTQCANLLSQQILITTNRFM